MKVIQKTEKEGSDFEDVYLSITVNGREMFHFRGFPEPEDASLLRDFNDCYKILDVIKLAYAAGKNSIPLEIETIEE